MREFSLKQKLETCCPGLHISTAVFSHLVTAVIVWGSIGSYFYLFWESGSSVDKEARVPQKGTIWEVLYFLYVSFTTIGLGDYSPSVESRFRITRKLTGNSNWVGTTMLVSSRESPRGPPS